MNKHKWSIGKSYIYFKDIVGTILSFGMNNCIMNKVTNLMRTMTSKRELWPKKSYFIQKKHENQPPNQKVVLQGSTIFSNEIKITTFFKHGLQNSYNSSKNPSKRHLNKKMMLHIFFFKTLNL
jgi:hypothetical protein